MNAPLIQKIADLVEGLMALTTLQAWGALLYNSVYLCTSQGVTELPPP